MAGSQRLCVLLTSGKPTATSLRSHCPRLTPSKSSLSYHWKTAVSVLSHRYHRVNKAGDTTPTGAEGNSISLTQCRSRCPMKQHGKDASDRRCGTNDSRATSSYHAGVRGDTTGPAHHGNRLVKAMRDSGDIHAPTSHPNYWRREHATGAKQSAPTTVPGKHATTHDARQPISRMRLLVTFSLMRNEVNLQCMYETRSSCVMWRHVTTISITNESTVPSNTHGPTSNLENSYIMMNTSPQIYVAAL